MRKITVLIFCLLIVIGCTPKSITDPHSEQRPTVVISELKPHMEVVTVYRDSMERDGEFPEKVVIDKKYYDNNHISRGDLVYVVADDITSNIARIIVLPNEKYKIEKGQIYINDLMLDTFYGHEFRWAGGNIAEKIYDTTIEEDTVPNEGYLIMADNWWRWGLGKVINKEQILGKVIGYYKK